MQIKCYFEMHPHKTHAQAYLSLNIDTTLCVYYSLFASKITALQNHMQTHSQSHIRKLWSRIVCVHALAHIVQIKRWKPERQRHCNDNDGRRRQRRRHNNASRSHIHTQKQTYTGLMSILLFECQV